ncbi:hypothetical protein M231_03171 [Tremella mesenterica]|uniref:HTH APSES-type domain-containing protein n=1 Tax=Tremella mesenterica TaxID=5217 RepID=A0A4Q1BP31_TREME|nr:hypothetical protein M231_03171 [Tremella mesenterica]
MDNDIEAFSHTAPPPPYPGSDQNTHSGQVQYDLTPTPHSLNRPRLPEDKRNQFLVNLPEDVTVVKFQTIVREGKEIVVGRIKVPIAAANRHAFILRRYDTNAISLTTMFKVAFPGASEEDEKREMSWVESTYDTRNTNGGRGSSDVRLAGQWVSGHLAIHLAPAYGISNLVTALARAVPDPTVVYHKSRRSQAAAEHIARGKTPPAAVTPTPIVPSMSSETTPAPKRVRRQSPRVNRPTASSNDQSAAEEDTTRHLTLEATTTVTAPANANVDMDAEIQSAKQLVMDLKRELQLRASVGEELEDQGYVIAENSRGVKRGKGEDDGVSISGGSLVKDRLVRKNKRVVADGMTQTAKRVAWGALIFGLGVGAAS